mmetsp:Transcript_13273/g.15124  ORF Transcript_13273/g.15124 Transcript_13273/m.15124 type:complete len:82 (-) Transcript_13273:71-316(-)
MSNQTAHLIYKIILFYLQAQVSENSKHANFYFKNTFSPKFDRRSFPLRRSKTVNNLVLSKNFHNSIVFAVVSSVRKKLKLK